jgi:hypothetical protein
VSARVGRGRVDGGGWAPGGPVRVSADFFCFVLFLFSFETITNIFLNISKNHNNYTKIIYN